jgi:hypothetical protein
VKRGEKGAPCGDCKYPCVATCCICGGVSCGRCALVGGRILQAGVRFEVYCVDCEALWQQPVVTGASVVEPIGCKPIVFELPRRRR